MLSLSLGYPKPDEEVDLLEKTLVDGAFEVAPVLSVEEVLQARVRARSVFVEESVQRYIVDIVNATRKHPLIVLGVSPRGSQLLVRAAQAAAFVSGRHFVTPEDIKELAPFVFGHRIIPKIKAKRISHADIIDSIITTVAAPH